MSERLTYKDSPDRIRSLIYEARTNIRCDRNFLDFSLKATQVELLGAALSVFALMYRPDIVTLAIPGFLGFLAIGSIGAAAYYASSEGSEQRRLGQLRELARRSRIYHRRRN